MRTMRILEDQAFDPELFTMLLKDLLFFKLNLFFLIV